MGMESPDNCREADDSYRAQRAGRSMCATGHVAPNKGVTDEQTSKLSINRALAGWNACDSDISGRSGRRSSGIASGKSEGQWLNPQFIIALAVGVVGFVARYPAGSVTHHGMRSRGQCFDLESVAG